MYKLLIGLILGLCPFFTFPQFENLDLDIKNMFSTEKMDLSFLKNKITLKEAAALSGNANLTIYFDQNIDTNKHINLPKEKLNSFEMFKLILSTYNLKYEVETEQMIRIFSSENFIPTIPFSSSAIVYISDEKYGCYNKIHELIYKLNIQQVEQASNHSPSLKNRALFYIPISGVYLNHRISLTCITENNLSEFAHTTVSGMNYPEVISINKMIQEQLIQH